MAEGHAAPALTDGRDVLAKRRIVAALTGGLRFGGYSRSVRNRDLVIFVLPLAGFAGCIPAVLGALRAEIAAGVAALVAASVVLMLEPVRQRGQAAEASGMFDDVPEVESIAAGTPEGIALLLPLDLSQRLAAVAIVVLMATRRTTEQKEEQEREEGMRVKAAPTMGTVVDTRMRRRKRRRKSKTRSGGR